MGNLPELVSAVTPLGDALREPTKRRRERAVKPRPETDTSVLCLCSERFDDFRSAYIHVRQGECPVLTNAGALRKTSGVRYVAVCGTTGGFARHKRLGEEVCPECLEASRVAYRTYRQANLERIRARDRARRAADPERATKDRAYRQANLEHYAELQRAYRARHLERVRARNRAYMRARREVTQ